MRVIETVATTATPSAAPIWKAVFEIEDGAGYDYVKGAFGWYGIRLTSSSFCLDFGIAKPLGAATGRWGSSSMPFLGLTLRSSVK